MTTAASLGNLLSLESSYNYYVQQLSIATAKYDANSVKLNEQSNFYTKWEAAYDDAQNEDKKCTVGDTPWKEKGEVLSDAMADAYAHAKVSQYNEETYYELMDLDIQFETWKDTLDTLCKQLSAQIDAQKELTSSNAQKTGLLNS